MLEDTLQNSQSYFSEPLIFERSIPGRSAFTVPACDVAKSPLEGLIPARHIRTQDPNLPEVSELDVVRHFTRLSQKNFSVDTNFYPLGSCTMKYNPKLNERVASLEGFSQVHPMQPIQTVQGLLRLMHDLESCLCEITGMSAFTLSPAAGAQGELTGMKMIRAYHRLKLRERAVILVPDSAHGTNPASAASSGFEVKQVASGADGLIDIEDLKRKLSRDVAALMLTNPNTLGLFEKEILAITKLCHEKGALVYLDGANMNAMLGITKPGDMGVDVIQLNMHKSFSTPHGGGGPGSGPVGVSKILKDFLPSPTVRKKGNRYLFHEPKRSIGRVHGFYGNVGMLVRAYAYISSLGSEGLSRVGKISILNANYLKVRLSGFIDIAFNRHCQHEFVASLKSLKKYDVTALDVAKRLLDFGFYAPTVYFPSVVEEAFMIEPTETESKETLDLFADALIRIFKEAASDPLKLKKAPSRLSVRRLDEVRAAREPDLRWRNPGPNNSAKSRFQSEQVIKNK